MRGNREVSALFLLSPRGDLSGAGAEAIPKEGGSWGKHGFPHGSEPKASERQETSVLRANSNIRIVTSASTGRRKSEIAAPGPSEPDSIPVL